MKVSHALGLVIVGYLAYTVWWKGASALAKAAALAPPAGATPSVVVRGPDGALQVIPATSVTARSLLSPTTGSGGCPGCPCRSCA